VTLFTLDTHYLTLPDGAVKEAEAIRALAAAHEGDRADVALVALSIAASRMPGAPLIADFAEFGEALERHGLLRVDLLPPMAYFDIAFPKWSLLPTEEMEDIEHEIHSILYPSIQYAWRDYRKTHHVEETAPSKESPWRMAKCDVQMMLAHIEAGRDVFVTSSEIFHREIKKRQLIALGASAIEYPAEAVGMI
jgi:hypothetical protein